MTTQPLSALEQRDEFILRHIGPSSDEMATMLAAINALLDDVDVTPTTAGLPGADLVQTMLNWLTQIALWGSLASILCGAAIYGLSQQTGNYSGGYLGKRLALAGAIGACLAGIAPTVINLLFKAAS